VRVAGQGGRIESDAGKEWKERTVRTDVVFYHTYL
jgi:hypothetical protein